MQPGAPVVAPDQARTVHQEIRKVQIDTATTLLAGTDLPVKQVAQRSGFKNVQYLTRVFRAVVGQPPAAFRRARIGSQASFPRQ